MFETSRRQQMMSTESALAELHVLAITGVGATYVYYRSGSTWTQLAGKILGTTSTEYPAQGRCVALNANGTVLAITGQSDGDGLGAVYALDYEYLARRRRRLLLRRT